MKLRRKCFSPTWRIFVSLLENRNYLRGSGYRSGSEWIGAVGVDRSGSELSEGSEWIGVYRSGSELSEGSEWIGAVGGIGGIGGIGADRSGSELSEWIGADRS